MTTTYDLAARIANYQRVVDWLKHRQHLPEMLAAIYVATLSRGGTVWFMGNGGSAADCQHLAAEYVGGMVLKAEPPLNARALTVDTSVLTALSNDYDYEVIFTRQLQAACGPFDTVVAHSTSGRSKNLTHAMQWVQLRYPKAARVALLGPRDTCQTSPLATAATPIYVETGDSQAVQLGHMMLQHLVVEVVEYWAKNGWRKQKIGAPAIRDPHKDYGE